MMNTGTQVEIASEFAVLAVSLAPLDEVYAMLVKHEVATDAERGEWTDDEIRDAAVDYVAALGCDELYEITATLATEPSSVMATVRGTQVCIVASPAPAFVALLEAPAVDGGQGEYDAHLPVACATLCETEGADWLPELAPGPCVRIWRV